MCVTSIFSGCDCEVVCCRVLVSSGQKAEGEPQLPFRVRAPLLHVVERLELLWGLSSSPRPSSARLGRCDRKFGRRRRPWSLFRLISDWQRRPLHGIRGCLRQKRVLQQRRERRLYKRGWSVTKSICAPEIVEHWPATATATEVKTATRMMNWNM